MTQRTNLALESLDTRVVPAAGDLDPGFGTAGGATLGGVPVADLAVQPDGKLVAVGTFGDDILVTRLNADGSLDTSFNGTGQRAIDFGGVEIAQAVAVQVDGRIVVAGGADGPGGSDFAVARLNPDGTPDVSFNPGSGGRFLLDLGGTDFATAVVVQPDQGIVVAGSGGASADFAVVRLTPAGALDPTFNPTFNGFGVQLVNLGGAEGAFAVALQPDNRIVLAGTAGPDIAVVRLSAVGDLDFPFGVGGAVVVDAGGAADAANAVRVQPDGGIVVAGGNDTDLVVLRLLPGNGAFDPSFGNGGRVVLGLGTATVANAAVVQPDGRIVVVGDANSDVFALRLDAAGAPDPSFGTGGAAVFDFTPSDIGTAVALTPAGRIVVGGAAGTDGLLLQLLGPSSVGGSLAVTGPPAGQAQLFAANPATGAFSPASTTIGPVPGLGFAPLRAATGDIDGDGTPDTVLVTGPGVPLRVAVVSGADSGTVLVAPFDPFGGDFLGGGYVAAGDLDGDGRAEFVVTPDEGGGPRVTVFSFAPGTTAAGVRANFLGIDDSDFRGGARSAVGDINGDGTPDVVVAAGFGGGPRTAIFRGQSVLAGAPARLTNDFFAFPGTDAVNLRNGSFVAAGDVTGDGFADLIFGGGPGGAPRVFVLSGALVSAGNVSGAQAAPVANFFVAGDAADRGGVRVGVADADGDGRGDVIAGSGAGRAARVRVYAGTSLGGGGEPAVLQDLTPFGGTVLADGVYVG